MEENKEDGAIPFLDTIVRLWPDNSVYFTLYRKPITDQYLQWDSHHHLSVEYSVINTNMHRARTVCNKLELLQKEMEHLRIHVVLASTPIGPWTGLKEGSQGMTVKEGTSRTTRTLLAQEPPPLKA